MVLGPTFVYLNQVYLNQAGSADALWEDAKKQEYILIFGLSLTLLAQVREPASEICWTR